MSTIQDIYPDYASALAACGQGYSDADIADVIAYKAKFPLDVAQYFPEPALNTLVALGIASGTITSRPLSVLDYGGGCGFHYFQAERVFGPMRWAIVESEPMATRASEVGQGRFVAFSGIGPACAWLGNPDLVHTSGTLQYVPDPIASLEELLALRAPYLMLARFPVWSGETKVGTQTSHLSGNGIGPMPAHVRDRVVRYPITFVDLDTVLGLIEQSGYEVLLTTPSPTADYVVAGVPSLGRTLFCRRRLPIASVT